MTRVLLAGAWLLHLLPLAVLAPLGQLVGVLAYLLVGRRRRVARTNLALCFPALGTAAREWLLLRHFIALGRMALECGIAWWSSPARLRRIVRVEGAEHLVPLAGKAYILLVPHFVGIEMEGLRISLDHAGMAVYAHQKNAAFDRFLLRRRERFPGTRMIARNEGIKPILRGLRAGVPMQLSPDLDLGARDAVFVPFFGVPAATVTALSRLARLARVPVLPLVVRQLPGARGYVLRIGAPWQDFPGPDDAADARRMNAFIEDCVREMPEQYWWVHRRFKTRPPGAQELYT